MKSLPVVKAFLQIRHSIDDQVGRTSVNDRVIYERFFFEGLDRNCFHLDTQRRFNNLLKNG